MDENQHKDFEEKLNAHFEKVQHSRLTLTDPLEMCKALFQEELCPGTTEYSSLFLLQMELEAEQRELFELFDTAVLARANEISNTEPEIAYCLRSGCVGGQMAVNASMKKRLDAAEKELQQRAKNDPTMVELSKFFGFACRVGLVNGWLTSNRWPETKMYGCGEDEYPETGILCTYLIACKPQDDKGNHVMTKYLQCRGKLTEPTTT